MACMYGPLGVWLCVVLEYFGFEEPDFFKIFSISLFHIDCYIQCCISFTILILLAIATFILLSFSSTNNNGKSFLFFQVATPKVIPTYLIGMKHTS